MERSQRRVLVIAAEGIKCDWSTIGSWLPWVSDEGCHLHNREFHYMLTDPPTYPFMFTLIHSHFINCEDAAHSDTSCLGDEERVPQWCYLPASPTSITLASVFLVGPSGLQAGDIEARTTPGHPKSRTFLLQGNQNSERGWLSASTQGNCQIHVKILSPPRVDRKESATWAPHPLLQHFPQKPQIPPNQGTRKPSRGPQYHVAAWLASASTLIVSPVLAGEPHFPSPMEGWTGDSGLSAGNGPVTGQPPLGAPGSCFRNRDTALWPSRSQW